VRIHARRRLHLCFRYHERAPGVDGLVLDFKIKNIPTGYNESKFIAFAIYNVGFVSLMWLAVTYGIGSSLSFADTTVLQAVMMLYGVSSCVALIFGPKFYAMLTSQGDVSFASLVKNASGISAGGSRGGTHLSGGQSKGSHGSHGSRGDSHVDDDDGKSSTGDKPGPLANEEKDDREARLLREEYAATEKRLTAMIQKLDNDSKKLLGDKEKLDSMAEKLGALNLEIQYHKKKTGKGAAVDTSTAQQAALELANISPGLNNPNELNA